MTNKKSYFLLVDNSKTVRFLHNLIVNSSSACTKIQSPATNFYVLAVVPKELDALYRPEIRIALKSILKLDLYRWSRVGELKNKYFH